MHYACVCVWTTVCQSLSIGPKRRTIEKSNRFRSIQHPELDSDWRGRSDGSELPGHLRELGLWVDYGKCEPAVH